MEKLFIKVLLATLFLSITGCFATFGKGGFSISSYPKCKPKSKMEIKYRHDLSNLYYGMTKTDIITEIGNPIEIKRSIEGEEGEDEYEQWIYKCQYKVNKKWFILQKHLLLKDGKLIYW